MVSIRKRTDTYVIDLDSPNWRLSTDQTVYFWDSLGESATPPHADAIRSGAEGIEGNWSAILVEDHAVTLVSDLVRSHALFYTRVDSRWVVADSIEKIRAHMASWSLDVEAAEVFEMAGFTLNDRTLVRDVRIVESASKVRLPFGEDDAQLSFWYLPTYANPGIGNAQEFSSLYTDALDDAFGALLEQSGDRQLVIPLSGGLDSRLLAAWLKKLRAPKVMAFTYGQEGSTEANIAQTVADKLGLEFVFVPLDVEQVRSLWFSESADAFRAYTWNASALPHIQDWYALAWLKEKGKVEDDAIFLPGHTPVGAMHNLELLEGDVSAGDIAQALADHHTLNPREKSKMARTDEFRRAVKRAFDQIPRGGRYTQNVVEWFNYRERQSKYINNSMTGYEFFGWDWALPLYWREPLSVWVSGSEELTAARTWYRDFVDAAYAQQSGESAQMDYFLPPAESSTIPFRDLIVTFSRKTGLNRAISWWWALKVQARHPLVLEAFVNTRSEAALLTSLVRHGSLMRMWTGDFLANRWGSGAQELVPPREPVEKGKPRLLIVSYSNIERDARLRKQIDLFTPHYDVTVVGHGDAFETDASLLLFPTAETPRTERIRAALLHARRYALAQRLEANNVAARKLLKNREFDAVIANDIEPVGMVIDLFGADKVHADLHEYYPGLQDQDPAWVKLREPYYRWMLANNVAKAASATTVSGGISERYRDEYKIETGIVANALPWKGMTPTPVHTPIAMVHLGAALPNRHIETMMRAAASTGSLLTFDLYLTGVGTSYYQSLLELSEELGDSVRLRPPLSRDELIPTLNRYDVGFHSLPSTATNNSLALPNKFFDFIQACLAVVVGPTFEMAKRVEEFDLGVVAAGFDVDDLVDALNLLDPASVAVWKENAARAARELDVTKMLSNWKDPVDRIAGVKL